MPAVAPPDDAPERHQLKPHEENALQRADDFQKTGRGYATMHATRPGRSFSCDPDAMQSLLNFAFKTCRHGRHRRG